MATLTGICPQGLTFDGTADVGMSIQLYDNVTPEGSAGTATGGVYGIDLGQSP